MKSVLIMSLVIVMYYVKDIGGEYEAVLSQQDYDRLKTALQITDDGTIKRA